MSNDKPIIKDNRLIKVTGVYGKDNQLQNVFLQDKGNHFKNLSSNISKNTTKRISFSRDDFEPIIENLKTYIDEINMHIENKTKFSIERSDDDEIKLIEV